MSKSVFDRYHPLQVTLHWLIVLLVVAAFAIGKSMSRLPNDDAKLLPLALHMSIGLLIFTLTAIRIAARVRLPKPDNATTGRKFLDWIAKAVHGFLYLLVLLMAVSGMSLALRSGLLGIVFGGSSAPLPADFFDFSARMLHGFVAPALLVLVLLHVAAAIYHEFVLKDRLLSRMWYGKRLEKKEAV